MSTSIESLIRQLEMKLRRQKASVLETEAQIKEVRQLHTQMALPIETTTTKK